MRSLIGALPEHPRRLGVAMAVPLLALATLGTAGLLANRALDPCRAEVHCATLADLRDGADLPEAMHIYDRHGAPLADVGGPSRHALTEEEIPEIVRRAFIAVEDRRFQEHHGVDWRSVARAAVRNALAGEVEEGASTIPMQLTRIVWGEALSDMNRWHRKLIELRMAPRLVESLGRDRLLTLYLNGIYLGNGTYGIGQAARHYFGVAPDSLDIGQLATLVGLTRTPERYEPRGHPERARARRDVVLRVLADEGVIGRSQADSAAALDLTLAAARGPTRRRSYSTAAVIRELRRLLDPELAHLPGLHVYTTLDTLVQAAGERALERQIEAIEAGAYGPISQPDSADPLQAAGVALEPATGAIRAWIGGRDFGRSQFDRVEQARRPVGSLVKPLLVAHALERGMGIVDLVSADTIPISTGEGAWLPDDHVEEAVLPLREALIRSSNRAAAHLGVALGLGSMRRVGRRMGVAGGIPAVPSAFIGAFDASLLEMTGVFAAFGNGGNRIEPHLIERVEDRRGEVLWRRTPQAEPVLDPAVAFVVLDALRDVVDVGTARPVRTAGYRGTAAAKTGTSNEVRDAWIVGLTPDLVAGVWIGHDRPRTTVPGGSGGMLAGPAWAHWMEGAEATSHSEPTSWTPPAGTVSVQYDRRTGDVYDPSCGREESDGLQTAWVRAGRHVPSVCRGSLRRWLSGLWHALVPRKLTPVVPPSRSGGGGGG